MNSPSSLPFQKPFGDALAALGTAPVTARAYYDEAWYDLEVEAIFKRTWLQVGHVCEIPEPGSFIRRELEFAKASILIVRGKDGDVRAFHNVCTHRGTQLVSEASGRKSTFSCPYHMWTFSTDGALISAPDFERFYVDKARCGLPEVSVDVCAGLIYINLDPAPRQELREFLGPMAEMVETLPVARATCFDEYIYEIDANWKITFDNFQENYHVRFVHRRVSGAPPMNAENPYLYPKRYEVFGPHRLYTNSGSSPDAERPQPVLHFLFGKLGEQLVADGTVQNPHAQDYFVFYPNHIVHGSPAMHLTHTVTPLSAGRSRGIFRFYWVGDDRSPTDRLVREFSMAFGREIHAEDGDVLRRCQLGLQGGALEHIHFQQQEVMCRHLYESTVAEIDAWLAEHGSEGAVT